MNDQNNPYDPGPFRRISLTEEQSIRFEYAARQRRDIHSYLGQIATLTHFINGSSPQISSSAFAGMKYVIDETRALIAALPARDLGELMIKCAAFENADPAVSAHRHLIALGDLSIRTDATRLRADPTAPWLAPWYEK